MNVIIVQNVDEIIDIMKMRFENANVEFIELFENDIRDEYDEIFDYKNNHECIVIEFDKLHDAIECNLRFCVALQFARKFNNDSIIAIAIESTYHEFELIHVTNDDDIRTIANINVDNNLKCVMS